MNSKTLRVVSILVVLVLLVTAVAACGQAAEPTAAPEPTAVPEPTKAPEPTEAAAPPPEAAEKPVIVMALDSDLDNLEPTFFKTDSAYYLTANLYQALLKEKYEPSADGAYLQGTFTFEPDGAESLTYSEDGKCATFVIRKGMTFENGAEVNAHSFKYGIDRALLGPGYLASLLYLGGVTDAEQAKVIDDWTLEVCAENKTPMFESIFAFSVIPAMDEATSKEHATDADPWATEWYLTNPNGSGPYTLTEWTPGEQYVVEPNLNYWQGEDYFQNSKIIVKLIPSPQDRLLLLKSGGIDLTIGIPFKDVDELKNDPSVNVLEIPYSRVRFLGMNNKLAPFDDVKVRQAVMYAIPYDTILEKAVYGHGRPAKSIIPSDFPSSDQEYWPYDTDPEKAKALLEEAGVALPIDVELAIRLSIPEDVEAATWIQSAMSEVGINVTVNKMTDAQFFDKLNTRQLPMFIHDWYSWLHDPYYQWNWLTRCEMGTNYVDYCNPEIDALFEEGLYEQDPARRDEISQEMQHIWLDDAPWAPLYHPNWIIGTSPEFKGFVVDFALMLQYAQMGK
jgi:peptide/nickel transport system substrate-binding protein